MLDVMQMADTGYAECIVKGYQCNSNGATRLGVRDRPSGQSRGRGNSSLPGSVCLTFSGMPIHSLTVKN